MISHKLMLRAGLIKKLGSGTYSYLPLGFLVLKKVENIIREEMNAAGAQEVLLPALQPVELWKKTGRYEVIGDVMIKFKDRHGKEFALGPTHEEVITDLVSGYIRSYRQLPLILYQIQTKFRDEPRPQSGVVRSKEFIMKDAYSFDVDEEGLRKNYQRMIDVYRKIFSRAGLEFKVTTADSGFIGGDISHEFVAPVKDGEDIEIGHIFKLGTKYSEVLGAFYLDEKGASHPMIMGCYGIGINRVVAAAIEQNHDKDGIIWPKLLAPYPVMIIPLREDFKDFAMSLYGGLREEGIETLLDDREEQSGVKFKDADLIGIPIRVIIGEEQFKANRVELSERKYKKSIFVPLEKTIEEVKNMLDKIE